MGLFETEHPSLFEELAPGQLKTDQVTSGSGLLFFWVCSEGHQYPTSVRRRVYGSGCPFCSGNKVLAGFNDFATTHSHLLPFWADDKVSPSETMAGSRTKVLWECADGHQKVSEVKEVARKGMTCKVCYLAGRQTSSSTLAETPTLSAELAPGQEALLALRTHSTSPAEWVCLKGHTYSASIKNRTLGRGCPYCAGTKVLSGFNDLATTHPELVHKWSPTEPATVSAGSEKEVTWTCPEGHTFQRQVVSMVKSPSCTYCLGVKVLPGFNDLATTHPALTPEWVASTNSLQVTEVSAGSGFVAVWRCPDKDHTYRMRVSDRARTTPRSCPTCQSSTGERELRDWIISLGLGVVAHSRSIIPPLEIDIFIPALKVGIEYNGLYWHSESAGKKPDYHRNKVEATTTTGVTLIQVWEDDWFARRPVIQKMILRKLGLSDEPKVGARKTSVIALSPKEAQDFLGQNHIQGFKASTLHLGLKTREGELVAVASYRKQQEIWYLERYATSVILQGGFTKLLKAFQSKHPRGTLVTFADQEVSNGNLYSNNGFILDSVLPPDYSYLYAGKRQHKFGFRKQRFENDPSLKFEPDLTERELAELNGIPRIWDSGKLKFVLTWELPG